MAYHYRVTRFYSSSPSTTVNALVCRSKIRRSDKNRVADEYSALDQAYAFLSATSSYIRLL